MPTTPAEPLDATLISGHEEHEIVSNATEARRTFFALLSGVVSDPTRVVMIEHKDLPGRAMLVGEGYRAYARQLEQLVALLFQRLQPAAGFSLIGSGSLRGGLGEALEETRGAQRGQAAHKFDTL